MKNIKIKLFLLSISFLSSNLLHADENQFYLGLGLGQTKLDSNVNDLSNLDVRSIFDGLVYSTVLFGDNNVSFDDSDTSLKFFAGYQFSDYFSFELGLLNLVEVNLNQSINFLILDQFGNTDGNVTSDASINIDGFYGALTGKFPLNESLSLVLKLGSYQWDAKFSSIVTIVDNFGSASGTSSIKDDGSDPFYGIGLSYNNFYLEYEIYDIDNVDAELIGISYKHFFN